MQRAAVFDVSREPTQFDSEGEMLRAFNALNDVVFDGALYGLEP